ncbi:YaaL family protein [Lentilactobacillus kefiri]|uniref:YaaL family protein n=1 Tax=Lentilactobacillus kefiri TaxID=33962 RepID=UPI0024692600|nr:YaaL family protein [Lentilactobacillus kefiri]MDH5107813.1 YaaL family protein [Lentilactobacillus kefiri]
MFFNRMKHRNVKKEYDQRLLELINNLKEEWDHTAQTQEAVADSDMEMEQETTLARRKYFFIYKEARIRKIKNDQIQPSVISYDHDEFE